MSRAPGISQLARLRDDSLKEKLHSQGFVVGTFVEIPSPAIVELLGLAGFDFVVIDREHGAIDLKDTENMIRAGLSTQISVMVRVPSCEPIAISQALDMGAAGVHVPQVNSLQSAQVAASASKYHPRGNRGLQPYVRSASYCSYPTDEYLAEANDKTMLVVHIEGQEAVSSLDTILQVKDIDVAFIGPYDLSQSLGIPGQVKHAQVREAMRESIHAAKKFGKWIGSYSDDVETAAEYRAAGVSYLTVSIDSNIFLSAARAMISQLK